LNEYHRLSVDRWGKITAEPEVKIDNVSTTNKMSET
jgi:hypothetical protein